MASTFNYHRHFSFTCSQEVVKNQVGSLMRMTWFRVSAHEVGIYRTTRQMGPDRNVIISPKSNQKKTPGFRAWVTGMTFWAQRLLLQRILLKANSDSYPVGCQA